MLTANDVLQRRVRDPISLQLRRYQRKHIRSRLRKRRVRVHLRRRKDIEKEIATTTLIAPLHQLQVVVRIVDQRIHNNDVVRKR